jgi:hypothetical protein
MLLMKFKSRRQTMLKPKYGNVNESVSDFNRILEGMNATQPLDRQDVDRQVREAQEEDRLRRELNHIERVLEGSGHFFTEREKAEWYTKRAQIAEMLGEEPEAIEESVHRPAAQRHESAIDSYRMLAGIDDTPAMPRDAGIFGSTRHNANYDANRESGESRPQSLWNRSGDAIEESAYAMSKVRKGAQRAERNGIAIRPEDEDNVPKSKGKPKAELGRSGPGSRGNAGSRHGEWKQPKKESNNRFRGISRLKR